LANDILLSVILTMSEIETFTGPKAQAKMMQVISRITNMARTDVMRFLLLNLIPASLIAGIRS
jgi:hypothetical protein